MTLMLHAGGVLATRDQIAAVPVPASTKSWHPRSHISVLTKVEELLDTAGYNITRQQLALSPTKNARNAG
jgi:hypothetical protein